MFVSLPTGSGKCLCYCLLPRALDFLKQRTALRESIVIVVSLLILLMQDQVWAMIECNITVVYIGGTDNMPEAEICAGNYQPVYCSPKYLLMFSLLSHQVMAINLMKTTRSRVRLHSCYAQKPV